VKPSNAKITLFKVIDEEEIKLNQKPYSINTQTTLTVPASDKIYMLIKEHII